MGAKQRQTVYKNQPTIGSVNTVGRVFNVCFFVTTCSLRAEHHLRMNFATSVKQFVLLRLKGMRSHNNSSISVCARGCRYTATLANARH